MVWGDGRRKKGKGDQGSHELIFGKVRRKVKMTQIIPYLEVLQMNNTFELADSK